MEPVRITKKQVCFIMVLHPTRGSVRVGNAYPDKSSAREWVPFVRNAWRGLKTTVEPFVIEMHDGKITQECAKVLDERFNMDVDPGQVLAPPQPGVNVVRCAKQVKLGKQA